MNILMLVLRFVHIVGAIVWGGGALMMEFFISRGISATGEAGQKFAQHLTNVIHIHVFMMAAAISTILAGTLLYWRDSAGFSSVWMSSTTGLGFGIGAGFGFIAFVFGAIFGNSNAQLGQIGAQITGKPTEEQLSKVQKILKRIKIVSPIHIIAMILAMTFMATARYFVF
jgi:uncharacterized membrane protein